MEIYERIIELRKKHLPLQENKKFNQTEFGKQLGVSRSVIKNLELGLVDVKEHMIKLICQTFNVNENWLRNGIEPIFIENEKDILNVLKNKYKLDDITTNLLETFIKLDEFSKKSIINFLIKSIENYYTNNTDKLDELYNKVYDLPQEKVKVIVRGEGITEISQEEFDRITKNAVKLDPKDYNKYF